MSGCWWKYAQVGVCKYKFMIHANTHFLFHNAESHLDQLVGWLVYYIEIKREIANTYLLLASEQQQQHLMETKSDQTAFVKLS